jgi:hypothetical protein
VIKQFTVTQGNNQGRVISKSCLPRCR